MTKHSSAWMAFLLATSLLCGCFHRTVVVERERRPRCARGAVWVPAHRGPYGRAHAGHWRCR